MEETAQRHGPIPRILEPKQTPENSPPASSAYSPTPPTFTALMARTPKARIGLLQAKLSPPPPRHQPWKTSPQATSWEPAPPSGPPSTRPAGKFPTLVIHYGDNDAGTGNWDSQLDLGLQTSSDSGNISDLTPGTTYFFRAATTNFRRDLMGLVDRQFFQQPQSIRQRLPTRLPAESTEPPPP